MECDRLDFVDVFCRELDNLANRVVVDAVDDRNNERDFNADLGQVLNRAHFHVEQVADAAMLVLLFSDTIELQVDAVLTGGLRGLAEFDVFGEADAVRRGEDSIEPNLFGIGNRVKIVRRKRRLAA